MTQLAVHQFTAQHQFSGEGLTKPLPERQARSQSIFKGDRAFQVELCEGSFREEEQEDFVPAAHLEQGALRETNEVETLGSDQLQWVKPARETIN